VTLLERVAGQPSLNFWLTNRIPRRRLTRFMAWFSQIRHPLVRDLSLRAFRFFNPDLDLAEARKTRFTSLHDCFVRELKVGARHIDRDPAVAVSPCDGIVGASGRVRGETLFQAKGRAYSLQDLLVDPEWARAYADGCYVTLRLKASMYHRFHAPHDCRVEQVAFMPGDTWNVNPPALERVPRLFARNERAALRMRLTESGHLVTLVAVAAVLVASIRLHFLDLLLHAGYRGPRLIPCDNALHKGEEMGWFQHGSTMLVFAPEGFALGEGVREGAVLRMGQRLLRLP
jgi:phosphatidylserine decarboxylase